MSLTPEEEAELAALEAKFSAPERQKTSRGVSAMLGAGQGASFGLVDEMTPLAVQLAAALDPNVDIPSYDEALTETRKVMKQARDDNPVTYTAAEIAGGLVPGAAVGNAAGKMVQGVGAGANILRGAAMGAAPGALYGAGNAEGDMGERAIGAAGGAVVGGIGGGLVAGAGEGITAARKAALKDPVVKTVDDILAQTGQSGDKALRRAMQQSLRAKVDDAVTLDTSKPLFEQGGEAVKSVAMGAARRGGKAGNIMGQYTDELLDSETIGNKASNLLSEYLDDPGYGLTEKLSDFARSVRDQAKPLYQKAYDAVPDINYQKVSGILDRLDPGELESVINYAGKMARREGRVIGVKAEDGTIKSLSSEAIDYISRALRDPAAFGDKPLGRGLISFNNEISRDLRNVLRRENPTWGKVVSEYSDAISLQDAAELGRTFSPSANAKRLSDGLAQFKKLNPNEQNAFRAGFAENLFGDIGKNPQSFVRKAGNPQFNKVLREIMGPEQADNLVAKLGNEYQLLNRARDVSRNSVTSNALFAAENSTKEQALADTAENLGSGNVSGLLRQLLSIPGNAARKGVERVTGQTPEADELLARALTTAPRNLGGTKQGDALLRALTAKSAPSPQIKKKIVEQLLAKEGAAVLPQAVGAMTREY